MLLVYFGVASLIAVVIIIVAVCTHDYTKDPRTGKDTKEKIDDYLLR